LPQQPGAVAPYFSFTTLPCTIVDADTMTCVTVRGVGTNLVWSFATGAGKGIGIKTPFLTSYAPPTIVSKNYTSLGGYVGGQNALPHTSGGEVLVITGTNFGGPGQYPTTAWAISTAAGYPRRLDRIPRDLVHRGAHLVHTARDGLDVRAHLPGAGRRALELRAHVVHLAIGHLGEAREVRGVHREGVRTVGDRADGACGVHDTLVDRAGHCRDLVVSLDLYGAREVATGKAVDALDHRVDPTNDPAPQHHRCAAPEERGGRSEGHQRKEELLHGGLAGGLFQRDLGLHRVPEGLERVLERLELNLERR
jgi:hypothetical protein